MSTRRARIKAVAALPQRRKNVDKADSKLKQDQAKEVAENELKSPKARRTSIDKRSGSSPARAALPSPRKSPRSPRVTRHTPDHEKVSSDWKLRTPTPYLSEKRSNTPLRDKTDTNKPAAWKADVFVSPQPRASPLRKRSPLVKTPVKEIDVGSERQHTPNKSPSKPQEDTSKTSKGSEKGENTESPKRKSATIPTNSKTDNVSGGYNSPNTPDTADVMDGIVPLKPISNAPKPIDLLKNEIISENAEVLFDPIVPLPSPTKVRQKLRPVPRLGPMRRNSVPGSASESEDESRRALYGGSSTPVPSRQRHNSQTSHSTIQSLPNRDVSRVRYDSVSTSQTAQTAQSPGSPLKEKVVVKTRRQDVSRRMAAMRRRRESVQREKLTMFDLIFYNPMGNPIVPDQDEIKAKEATKKEAKKEEEQRSKVENKKEEPREEATDDSSAPVPQIKLGPNGEIVLDEQSLVIKQSEQRKLSDSVVHEGAWMSSTGRVYRRTPRTADWSDAETVRFYRALAALGTDFSLMVELFPGRTRRDLKLKFKKEERTNLSQIDKALRSVTGWDASRLENEFANERKMAKDKDNLLKERLKNARKAEKEQNHAMKVLKVRRSKGSKALGMSILPTTSAKSKEDTTANDIILRAIAAKKTKKQDVRETKEIEKDKFIPSSPKHTGEFATLTPIRRVTQPKVGIPRLDMATIQRSKLLVSPATRPSPLISPAMRPTPQISPAMRPTPQISPAMRPPYQKSPVVLNALPAVPADIAPGSLVVLTVDDPKAPSQKAIHTYIKQGDGSITSIILDPSVMSSLVSYVKKDTPKAGSSSSIMSPCSVTSDRTSTPPIPASPKRKRLSSYTITQL